MLTFAILLLIIVVHCLIASFIAMKNTPKPTIDNIASRILGLAAPVPAVNLTLIRSTAVVDLAAALVGPAVNPTRTSSMQATPTDQRRPEEDLLGIPRIQVFLFVSKKF